MTPRDSGQPAERRGQGGSECDEAVHLEALGAFIWQDQARVRTAATRLDAAGVRSIECELQGGSMEGSIPGQCRIRICVAPQQYEKGQIVAFMADGRLVVHRVAYRGRSKTVRDYLITQGDRMILPDRPVQRSAVVGIVTEFRSGTQWQPAGARVPSPRRERLLSMAVLTLAAASLELVGPRFSRWLLGKLEDGERRCGWTRALLY